MATDVREKRLGDSIWVETVRQRELLQARSGRLIVYRSVRQNERTDLAQWGSVPPPQCLFLIFLAISETVGGRRDEDEEDQSAGS